MSCLPFLFYPQGGHHVMSVKHDCHIGRFGKNLCFKLLILNRKNLIKNCINFIQSTAIAD